MLRRFLFVVFSWALLNHVALSQSPPRVDEERTERFVESLTELAKSRATLQKQCNAIQQQDAQLMQQFHLHWQGSIAKQEALLNTPQYTAFPILRGIASSNRSMGNRLRSAAPHDGDVWLRIQDNSLTRTMLAASAFSDQRMVQSTYQSLIANRAALLDIAHQADRNFALLRAKVDWLGRRSSKEHQEALEIARKSRVGDPRNAGMALIEAAAHRSLGDFGAADDVLDEIDDYFFQLQVIHAAGRAQFDFINNNHERSKKTLAEVVPIAKERGWIEPLLIRGWIAMADDEPESARRWAYEAKQIAPENVEVAVLIAWSILHESPRKAKEAVSILRDTGIRISSDDWFFQEAMAHGFAKQSEWRRAGEQLAYAMESAPTHHQASLQKQLESIENKVVPPIDWKQRLQSHWKLGK